MILKYLESYLLHPNGRLSINKLNELFDEFGLDSENYDEPEGRNTSKSKRINNFMRDASNKNVKIILTEMIKICRVDDAPDPGIEISTLIKNLPVDIPEPDPIQLEVSFENQESMILENFSNAKYLIWISMYTFTNKRIFDKLLVKQGEGINVQLIVHDSPTNRECGIDYSLMNYFGWHHLFGANNKNFMHRKSSIIDLEIVLQGSYNFTRSAEFHCEDCTKVENRKIALQYADEFMKMKKEIKDKTLPW